MTTLFLAILALMTFLLQTGLLFNQKTQSCDRQENLVPNDPCRGYYNETFLEGLKGKRVIRKLCYPCHENNITELLDIVIKFCYVVCRWPIRFTSSWPTCWVQKDRNWNSIEYQVRY